MLPDPALALALTAGQNSFSEQIAHLYKDSQTAVLQVIALAICDYA